MNYIICIKYTQFLFQTDRQHQSKRDKSTNNKVLLINKVIQETYVNYKLIKSRSRLLCSLRRFDVSNSIII